MGAALISILVCIFLAVAAYMILKNFATDQIYKETDIFIGTADAIRRYVKDVLRPVVADLLPEEGFVPHAMSTTFVGREIMNRLGERFPDFSYKRATCNPTNPINLADALETEKIHWFSDNPDQTEWHGLIGKGNSSYYARFNPIRAEKACLRCHGNPEDAPRQMKEIYGTQGGFGYRVGEVVAADVVYIPHVAADLKQTHDELSASESKYRKLFESSRDAIDIAQFRS